MEKQVIQTKKSPVNNAFVNATFEAFKADNVQTQHKSAKKIALQEQIDAAKEKFLNSGKQVKIACVGLQDNFNPKTGKFGLQKVETFKTESQLLESTFVETSKLSDESLKKSFSAKGTRSYSYGLTKKVSFQKTLPIHEIRKEIRRNSKSLKNSNGTKGFISCNSAVVTGQKLAYEKEQKLASMLRSQARLNTMQDKEKAEKQENKLSKLTAKFSAIVAESLQNKKEEQAKIEKLAKFESKIFAIKQSYSKKESISNIDRIEVFEEIKAGEPCKKVEKVDCIIQDDGQLAFNLSA